jgi:hypothetical protein
VVEQKRKNEELKRDEEQKKRNGEHRDDQGGKNQNGKRQKTDGGPKPQARSKPKPKPTQPITQKIEAWHKACVAAFLNKPSMREFPQPPAEPCKNVTCAAESKDRVLVACKCNIRKALEHRRAVLKKDRVKFPPDRFSTCPEDVREEIQKAAKEVFVVVDGMYGRT